jgi:hypothetical protein
MPLGDRTGPWGFGPMTGRAAGYCAGYSGPGYVNPVPGRGFGRGGWGRGWGRGFGGGRGWGRGFGWGPYSFGAPYGPYAPAYVPAYAPSYGPEDEVTALKDQAKYFEEALQEVKKRIEEIESSAEKE